MQKEIRVFSEKTFQRERLELNYQEEELHRLMIFGNTSKDSVVTIGNSAIKEGNYEKL